MTANNQTAFGRPHEFNRSSSFAFRMAAAATLTAVLLVGMKIIHQSGFLGEPGRLMLVGMIIIPAALIVRIFSFWYRMFGTSDRRPRATHAIIDATMWPVVVAFAEGDAGKAGASVAARDVTTESSIPSHANDG